MNRDLTAPPPPQANWYPGLAPHKPGQRVVNTSFSRRATGLIKTTTKPVTALLNVARVPLCDVADRIVATGNEEKLLHLQKQVDNRSMPVKPEGYEYEQLQPYIGTRSRELGLLLGLPAEYLVGYCHNEYLHWQRLLEHVLDSCRSLNLARLVRAVEKISTPPPWWRYTLDNLAKQHHIDWQSQLTKAQLQILLPHLPKHSAFDLGLALGLSLNQLEYDEQRLLRPEQYQTLLKRVMSAAPPFTAMRLSQVLIHGLREYYCTTRLDEWIEKNSLDVHHKLTASEREQVVEQVLAKTLDYDRVLDWYSLGELLKVEGYQFNSWQQHALHSLQSGQEMEQVLLRADLSEVLNRENLLLALAYLGSSTELIGLLAKSWNIQPQYIPKPVPKERLWKELEQYHQKQQPLPLCLVYPWLGAQIRNPDWLRLLFDLGAAPVKGLKWDAAQEVVLAGVRGVLTLETLTRIGRAASIMSFKDCPPVLTAPEVSAPLQWPELAQLIGPDFDAWPKRAAAISTALLLGMARDNLLELDSYSIWMAIVKHLPLLQSGHLRQLFEAHPSLRDSVADLAYGAQTPEPTVPLAAIDPFAQEFSGFAKALSLEPPLVESMYQELGHSELKQLADLPILFQVLYQALSQPFRIEGYLSQCISPVALPQLRQQNELPPSDYFCPITQKPMTDPVAIPVQTGRAEDHLYYCCFSKIALLKTLEENPVSQEHPPMGRHPLSRIPVEIDYVKNLQVDTDQRDKIARNMESFHSQ